MQMVAILLSGWICFEYFLGKNTIIALKKDFLALFSKKLIIKYLKSNLVMKLFAS